LNSREKFNSAMSFDSKAQNIKTEFGYWAGTIRNWFKSGLPKIEGIPEDALDADLVRGSTAIISDSSELVDKNVMAYFNMDSYLAKFPFDISPLLKTEVLEDNKDYKIFTDSYGLTQKVTKRCAATPMVVDYPIKGRNDFYSYIQLYDDKYSKRLPENWEDLISNLKNRDFPIRLGGNPFGFSFLARHLMGEVGFMLSMYDDPKLIKELNEFFLNYVMNYWSKILDKVDIDCIFILEDIAYRSGSFISKEMFYEFMSPYYLRFVDFLKQYKIENIFVDCDGLIDELIPLWIEVGITGIFPIEAVNNLMEIRKKYPGLKLLGGVDKKVLFKDSDRDKIDEELEKISLVMGEGGYIPHIDHAVSEDVTLENFSYYRRKLNNIIDKSNNI
jgi:uroporphyrinogen decarboxylase